MTCCLISTRLKTCHDVLLGSFSGSCADPAGEEEAEEVGDAQVDGVCCLTRDTSEV